MGLYLVKRYTENTGQGDPFAPLSKWCVGPLCLSQYGPPVSRTPGQGGQPQVPSGGWSGYTFDPLGAMCDWPGSWMILPPCFYKNPVSQEIAT